MVNINTKLKRIGNSLGIVVPSEIVNNKELKEGQELIISIEINEGSNVNRMLEEARKQKLKFKRSTQKILDEINKDSY
jgi:antitoxin component of MazEF toxin-antitoxin module